MLQLPVTRYRMSCSQSVPQPESCPQSTASSCQVNLCACPKHFLALNCLVRGKGIEARNNDQRVNSHCIHIAWAAASQLHVVQAAEPRRAMRYARRFAEQRSMAEGRQIAAQYEEEAWRAAQMQDAAGGEQGYAQGRQARQARQAAAEKAAKEEKQAAAEARQKAVQAALAEQRDAKASQQQAAVAAEQAAAQAAAQLLQEEEAEAAGAAQQSAKKAAKKARQKQRKQVCSALPCSVMLKLAEMLATHHQTHSLSTVLEQHGIWHAWQIKAE